MMSMATLIRSRTTAIPLHRLAQRLSTALAAADGHLHESTEAYNRRWTDATDMPRLRALRERLRQEDVGSIAKRISAQNIKASGTPVRGMNISELKVPDMNYSYRTQNILTDTHGRHHNYLRISLSERCNLRCQYCMPPEGVPLSPPSHLLTNDEIIRLVDLFVENGVNKVRLTGGEPLLRPDIVPLVRSISDSLKMSQHNNTSGGLVGITTNGISLSRHIEGLVDAGLTGVNISLDTLREDRFVEITRRKGLHKVMRAIHDTIDVFKDRYGNVRSADGGSRVKINCVVMKEFNDDELQNFVHMANEQFSGDIDMRFIEWMPFNDNGWNRSRFVSYKDMMSKISSSGDSHMQLERIEDGPNDTTKWWSVLSETTGAEKSARIGFITSMSEHFCASCNRLRITADGKIKVCLFGSNEKEVSLRDIMRSQKDGSAYNNEDLSRVIHAAVQKKALSLGGHENPEGIALAADNRPMTLIGG